jgi:hypothetical protein
MDAMINMADNNSIKFLTDTVSNRYRCVLCFSPNSEKDNVVHISIPAWNDFRKAWDDYNKLSETPLPMSLPKPLMDSSGPKQFTDNDNSFKISCDSLYWNNKGVLTPSSNRRCSYGDNITLDKLKNNSPNLFGNITTTASGVCCNPTVCLALYDFFDEIGNRTNEFNSKLAGGSTNGSKYITDKCIEALGFDPTIQNMYRMLFAHVDCFMSEYYDLLGRIKVQNRKLKDFGVPKDYLDMNKYATDDSFVPPFPAVYQMDDNRKIAVYPGIVPNLDKIEEVQFIEKFMKGVIATRNSVTAYQNNKQNEINNEARANSADHGLVPYTPTNIGDFWSKGATPWRGYDSFATNDDNYLGGVLYYFTLRLLSSRLQTGLFSDTQLANIEAANYIAYHPDVTS